MNIQPTDSAFIMSWPLKMSFLRKILASRRGDRDRRDGSSQSHHALVPGACAAPLVASPAVTAQSNQGQKVYTSLVPQKSFPSTINDLKPHNDLLCSVCAAIPPSFWASRGVEYLHYEGYAELKSSADSSHCPLCIILLNTIDLYVQRLKSTFENEWKWRIRLRRSRPKFRSRPDDEDPSLFIMTAPNIANEYDNLGLHVDTLPCYEVFGPKLISDGTPQELIPIAKAWIEECVKEHPWCPKNDGKQLPKSLIDPTSGGFWVENKHRLDRSVYHQDTNFIPTRLLSISSPIKIILTSTLERPWPKYIALSHCWGAHPEKTLTTTSLSLAEHMNGITLKALPTSFRDAVTMARSLDIGYIWIDSLCIIQDSGDDWDHESTLMGLVYANAFCTFVAASAADSMAGLFPPRDMRLKSPCMLEFQSSESPSKKDQYVIHPKMPSLTEENAKDPLSSRAWTMQERELSPRMLIFCKHQLLWECRCKIASEFIPKSQKESLGRPLSYHMEQLPGGSDTRGRNWNGIVETYSRMNLTFGKDKLPALSGIAKMVMDDDEYIAGMWKSDLVKGLLWQRKPGEASLGTSTVWRAPSWSWAKASINGPIIYHPDLYVYDAEPCVEIVEVATKASGLDPTGLLSGGILRLHGVGRWINQDSDTHGKGSGVVRISGDKIWVGEDGREPYWNGRDQGEIHLDVPGPVTEPVLLLKMINRRSPFALALCKVNGDSQLVVENDLAASGGTLYERIGFVQMWGWREIFEEDAKMTITVI